MSRRWGRDEWEQALDTHRDDKFAHTALIDRIMEQNKDVRQGFESRVSSLERFRAQATLLGGMALLILGAVATAVATHIFK